MKKFIINILKFLGFIIPAYIVLLFFWSFFMPQFLAKNVRNKIAAYGHLFTRVHEIKNYKNPDILFLGSSHAYRGFDPRIFSKMGYRTFNLGSSSQSPINSKVLLNQYLKEIKPKFVVYEICGETLETDGVESSLDLLSNNTIDENAFEMAISLNNIRTYNTLFYNYLRQKIGLNKFITEPKIQDGNQYISGGYVESEYRKNPLHEEKKGKWKIIDYQIDNLKQNIAILKKNKIPFILVQTPISEKMYNARNNNKETELLLSKMGKFKSFQGEIKLNDTIDFYDSNHLNQEAVVKFNLKFIDYLKSQNIKF